MRIKWIGGDASLSTLGLRATAGDILDVPADAAESLIAQGKATKSKPKPKPKTETDDPNEGT
ncbi:MAG: hypothetical protein GY698_24000 [Actinomycetia bacterium]|nr:hypothetical protein [Actinomycetes bacterium]